MGLKCCSERDTELMVTKQYKNSSDCECENVLAWLTGRVEINWVFQPCTLHLYVFWVFPASHDEYTALESSQWNVSLVETWIPRPIELCDVSSGYVVACPLLFFPSARVNWCNCASVVIFSNSVVINSLSSFSVPFSVISLLRIARCKSLLSVGVVEQVVHQRH